MSLKMLLERKFYLLKTSTKHLKRFKNLLQSGAFSEVIEAIDHRTKMHVAIKCIKRKALKGKEETLQNEINVLRKYEKEDVENFLNASRSRS
jgi:serine/threonine protein kinase